MTNTERNKKFRKERTRVLRSKTALQRDTLKEIDKQLKAAQAQVKTILAAAPTEYEAFYLAQLQKAITQAMTDLGNQAGATLSNSAGQAWQLGLDLIEKPIEAGGLRISAVLPAVDTRQLVAMRHFMTDRMKDVGLQLANKINTELGLVAIGAETTGEATTVIASYLQTGGRSRAIGIIRTELGTAFSSATQQRQLQAKAFVPGLKKQWRRSGKTLSRVHHDLADGQKREVDEPFELHTKKGIVKMMYPRDPAVPIGERMHCGCESIPYMESWEMTNPGKMPFTPQELTDPNKRNLASAEPLRRTG